MDRNQLELLNRIRLLENNKENNHSRKVKLSDLIEDTNSDSYNMKDINIKNKVTKDKNMKDKIKDYRLQEEFGEKKFIKP